MALERASEQVSAADSRPWWPAWRLVATIGVLSILGTAVDLRTACAALRGADPLAVVAALGLVQAQVVLSAWRWTMVAGRLGLRLRLGPAIAEYYVASLLNLVLPGGVSGDAVRAVRIRLREPAAGWRPLIRSIVLERTVGQVAMVGLAAIGLAGWSLLMPGEVPTGLLQVAAGALGVGGSALLILVALGRLGPRPLRTALSGFGADARKALAAGSAWAVQGALSLTIVAGYVATFALAAAAIGSPLPAAAIASVVPLVLLSMAVPVTVGGWGVREGVAAALWPLLGLAPELGLATSVLYGLIILIGSLPGAAVLSHASRRSRQTTSMVNE